jgi:aldose 1-epimerase
VIAPTGEQYELAHGDHRAVVTEVGAGLRVYDDLLDGFGADEMPLSGRGQVLMPWPNRVLGGTYEFDGETHVLPLRGDANHGLVRWVNWRLAERDDARVALQYVLHPQPGYPFTLALRVEYELGDDGLTVRTRAENVGTRACPFGAGHHPYVARHADEVFGEGVVLDECRPFDGQLRAGDVTVWADEHWPYVQLFTGDTKPDVARRSVAIEPMTCPPNAFNTGEGLIRLEPADVFEGRWGIARS